MASKIVLFTGPINSGKTTRLMEFVEKLKLQAANPAGLLSLKNYNSRGMHTGYNLMNIKNGTICENGIKRKSPCVSKPEFFITDTGLDFGRNALEFNAVKDADIVIVDEFGPLELKGGGWRNCIDKIIENFNSVLLLSLRLKILGCTNNILNKLDIKTVKITVGNHNSLRGYLLNSS